MSKFNPQGGNRAAELSALLTDAPKADDHDGVRAYLHGLAALGCAPLLVYPSSKKPADVRTPQTRRADDRAAREAAQAAGHPRPQTVKSQAGVHLATADTDTLDRYLTRYVETFSGTVDVNVAVSLGRSRLVVVDCDTAAQLAAFLTDAEVDLDTAPTVRTPGMFGPDGVTLVHRDGGHFYFTVPEGVELPPGPPGSMKVGGDDGYAVMWGVGNYVLTPPSVRAEGTYTATGEPVFELPDWLAERIAAHGQTYADHAQRSLARADTAADPVAQWGAGVGWAAILEPAGWTPVGKADGCGCPTWTAPGVHGNPKSATAHERGCGRWADALDPPLHVWTDNPGDPWASRISATGKPTFSKLQAVALLHYDGKEGAAMDALGIDLTNGDEMVPPGDVAFLDTYRPRTQAAPGGHDGNTGGVENDPIDAALTEKVFGHSEVTEFLMRRAEIRMVSPWAMLGTALVQAAGMVPWWVRLPPFVGNDASANLLVAFAGMSGAGKGAAADPGINWDAGWDPAQADDDTSVDDMRPTATAEHLLRERKPGSGQAFAALFMGLVPGVNAVTGKPCQVVCQTARVAHISYPEVDGYTKLATQQGSTVFDVTRQLFDGKNLGEFTKDRMRVSELPPFGWRAVLSMHGQPERYGPLLDDDAGGTPQRIVWIHPDWPLPQCELAEEPDAPPADELAVTYPAGRVSWPGGPDQVAYIAVDPEIGRILRNIRRRRTAIRSEHATTEDKQGSHRGLLRFKVAVAVAVLHGRAAVAMSDWELAGLILEHSDRTIALVRRVLSAEQVKVFVARGHFDEIREGSKASAHTSEVGKAGQRILDWLAKKPAGTTITESDVRRDVLSKQQRGYATEALAALVADDGGLVEAGENRKGNATYRLADDTEAVAS